MNWRACFDLFEARVNYNQHTNSFCDKIDYDEFYNTEILLRNKFKQSAVYLLHLNRVKLNPKEKAIYEICLNIVSGEQIRVSIKKKSCN